MATIRLAPGSPGETPATPRDDAPEGTTSPPSPGRDPESTRPAAAGISAAPSVLAAPVPPLAPALPHRPPPVTTGRLRTIRQTVRYLIARTVSILLTRSILRVDVEGRHNLPEGSYLICFSHGSWADPFVLMAVLPWRPRLSFFGPKEEDMTRGGRNRLMLWAGNAVPYRPGKNDLLDATRRVQAIFDANGVLAIAGEGRIHPYEGQVLPISEGAAYFAVRAGVPIVPLVINGMSWFSIGSRVRVSVGRPIETSGRPTHDVIEELTARTQAALVALSAGARPGRRPGRFGRWLTELFNEWPEGSRPE